ncbi:MAG: Ig-like domain-containing protein [Treponema sp.]|jgi:hypothetical protein|nr:Ig-like domain-containing protein [Treponema sp.]
MAYNKSVIIIISALLMVSCGDILLPPLTISSVSVPAGYVDPASLTAVTIEFSADPEIISIEKALSLTENGSVMDGILTKNDTKISFAPMTGFVKNKNYVLIITTDAEDSNGNSLLKEFRRYFTTRLETDPPQILSITPDNDSELTGELEALEIQFSEPVDIPSFVKSFIISPSFPFLYEFFYDDTHVKIIRQEPLVKNQRYTVTIGTSLMDRAGNELSEPVSINFLNGNDRLPPEYTLYLDGAALSQTTINEGISVNAEFSLEFNKKVMVDSLSSYISISPQTTVKITADKESRQSVKIQCTSGLMWGKTYTLTVRKGVADNAGNKTETDVQYILVCNKEAERPLTVLKGYLDVDSTEINDEDRFFPFMSTNIYSTIIFPAPEYPIDTPVATSLYFVVNASSGASAVSLVSAMQSIRMNTANSCLNIDIKNIQCADLTDTIFDDISSLISQDNDLKVEGGKNMGIRVYLEITNRDANGLITLSIAKDLCDNLKNTLQTAWETVYNKG